MEIQELAKIIAIRNKEYRLGCPTISDTEYDKLVDELRKRDPNNSWFKQIEPSAVNTDRKVKLPIPMKSLNKVKSINDIKQWLSSLAIPDNAKLVVMPKFDGVSWLRDEISDKVYSRGGADNEGQDCSKHYSIFASDNKQNNGKFHYTFGELVFQCKTWERELAGKISDATGEKMKSPRNTVAGLINRDEPSEIIKLASFYRYGVSAIDLDDYETYSQLLQELCKVYNQTLYCKIVTVSELSEEKLSELFKKWRSEYYIDGLVIYLNDLRLWDAIGRQQTTGNPLYAIAYKHPDFTDVFESTVKNVTWKISKAGALKPVVNIDAVDTGDCTMENPTGYNARYVFENKIVEGARITLTRSGGVIPKILSVIKPASCEILNKQQEELMCCPYCGKPTKWNDSHVEIICTNDDCTGRRLAKMVHFYTTLEAENIGEDTIIKMFNAGYDTLRRILDITFDELMLIDGIGENVANIVLSANAKIRSGVNVIKLMHASDCFSGIGQVKAKTIVSSLSDTDRFAFCNGYVFIKDDFEHTPWFMSLNKTLQSFYKGITPFYEFIAKNKLKVLPMEEQKTVVGDKCAGMKICFTGIRDKQLEDKIMMQGGEVVSGVTKTTTHLIVADLNTTSSKAKKARLFGIPVLTIESFEQL